jgi:hypothetical protein
MSSGSFASHTAREAGYGPKITIAVILSGSTDKNRCICNLIFFIPGEPRKSAALRTKVEAVDHANTD